MNKFEYLQTKIAGIIYQKLCAMTPDQLRSLEWNFSNRLRASNPDYDFEWVEKGTPNAHIEMSRKV